MSLTSIMSVILTNFWFSHPPFPQNFFLATVLVLGNFIEKCGCVDDDPKCPTWAATDDNCQTNKDWMRVYCRKSCGDCGKKFSTFKKF